MIMRYTTAFLLFASSEVFAKKTFGVNQSLSVADQCDAVNSKTSSKFKCRQYGRNDGEKFRAFKKRGQPCKWFTRSGICKATDFEFPDNSTCKTYVINSDSCVRAGCKWNKNKCTALNIPKPCAKLKKKQCRRNKSCRVEKKPYACVDVPVVQTLPAPTTPAPTTPAPTTPAPTSPPFLLNGIEESVYRDTIAAVDAGTKTYHNLKQELTLLESQEACIAAGGVLAWVETDDQWEKFKRECKKEAEILSQFATNGYENGTEWILPSGKAHDSYAPPAVNTQSYVNNFIPDGQSNDFKPVYRIWMDAVTYQHYKKAGKKEYKLNTCCIW